MMGIAQWQEMAKLIQRRLGWTGLKEQLRWVVSK